MVVKVCGFPATTDISLCDATLVQHQYSPREHEVAIGDWNQNLPILGSVIREREGYCKKTRCAEPTLKQLRDSKQVNVRQNTRAILGCRRGHTVPVQTTYSAQKIFSGRNNPDVALRRRLMMECCPPVRSSA